jgi:hypothetical protein
MSLSGLLFNISDEQTDNSCKDESEMLNNSPDRVGLGPSGSGLGAGVWG